MSGTSLDGLDLALCEFTSLSSGYSYKIIAARTTMYSAIWKKRLIKAKNLSAEAYFSLNSAYGAYIAGEINTFLKNSDVKPDLISSHGHTIFHQPQSGFSTQLGCGATIASQTEITTVCDFRSLDVACGGQGAPLVPIGDKLLFSEFDACLNIGGIANISFDNAEGKRTAYDVCEANMLLNYLAERVGKNYDSGGEMARVGKINYNILAKLDSLNYYSQKGAKSIGREWFEKNILVCLKGEENTANLLRTCTEHIANIITQELNNLRLKNVFVTGGGAFNTFLIEQLKLKTRCEVIIPNGEIVNFKEALIFAFLGYLRIHKKINTLCSVTGSQRDSIGGAVYEI
jgi:anhydro-N-acetylmuramic acid kinase